MPIYTKSPMPIPSLLYMPMYTKSPVPIPSLLYMPMYTKSPVPIPSLLYNCLALATTYVLKTITKSLFAR